MARIATPQNRPPVVGGPDTRLTRLMREVKWIAFMALTLALFAVLASYSKSDPAWSHANQVANISNIGDVSSTQDLNSSPLGSISLYE